MTERITGHLRGWLDKTTFIPIGSPTRCAITRLADEIDQALEDELAKERARTENEYEALRDGWVRLPLDADGVPIRVGDMVTFERLYDEHNSLRDENERLRELVRDMWRGSVTRMDFADRYAFIGEFVDRIRELEVVE